MTSPHKTYGNILKEHGLSLKKRLGQHFMLDPQLLDTIASIMIPGSSWVAFEIGAGIGTLTRALSKRARWVYAVEIDEDLKGAVAQTCQGLSNVTWIWGDALKTDLSGRTLKETHLECSLVLCGNLPYYITSEVLYTALVKRSSWNRMAFVVQEEVGERMVASPGSRQFGRASLWCQYRAKVTLVKKIPPGAFVPPPEVGSCLVVLDVYPSFPLTEAEEELLDRISRVVFAQRRKTILKSLLDLVPEKDVLYRTITENQLDPQKRPEALTVDEFISLTRALSKLICAI